MRESRNSKNRDEFLLKVYQPCLDIRYWRHCGRTSIVREQKCWSHSFVVYQIQNSIWKQHRSTFSLTVGLQIFTLTSLRRPWHLLLKRLVALLCSWFQNEIEEFLSKFTFHEWMSHLVVIQINQENCHWVLLLSIWNKNISHTLIL
jgi:hypothetical protein